MLAAHRAGDRRLVAAREQRARREVACEPPHPREAHRTRPGDPNRVRELRSRLGWAWTRIVRTHDDYERVLEHVASGHDDAHGREPTAV
jgi:hypothetical protein